MARDDIPLFFFIVAMSSPYEAPTKEQNSWLIWWWGTLIIAYILPSILGVGFTRFQIFFIFTPICGRFPIWRAYFSDGLVQPPTSIVWMLSLDELGIPWNVTRINSPDGWNFPQESRKPSLLPGLPLGWWRGIKRVGFFQVLKWTTWRIIPGLVRAENNHG